MDVNWRWMLWGGLRNVVLYFQRIRNGDNLYRARYRALSSGGYTGRAVCGRYHQVGGGQHYDCNAGSGCSGGESSDGVGSDRPTAEHFRDGYK